jgi:hypothetical protein
MSQAHTIHIACFPRRTRFHDIFRSPDIDPIKKNLLKLRLANLSAAQNGYIEKQNKALVQ